MDQPSHEFEPTSNPELNFVFIYLFGSLNLLSDLWFRFSQNRDDLLSSKEIEALVEDVH
jgi:hypothetical protein